MCGLFLDLIGATATRCTFLSDSTVGSRLLNAAQTLVSEGGAGVSFPPRSITITITHFCVRVAFQPHGSWSIAQWTSPMEPCAYEWTSTCMPPRERACQPLINRTVLPWLTFWNPFKTVNHPKLPSSILYTPLHDRAQSHSSPHLLLTFLDAR